VLRTARQESPDGEPPADRKPGDEEQNAGEDELKAPARSAVAQLTVGD
jgi:hypothetical protein